MPKYFEFEIAAQGIRPRIWRRVLLPVTATFRHLHNAIQDASGSWFDYHLHAFNAPGRGGEELCGSPSDPDDFFGNTTTDSRKVRLSKWFPTSMPQGPRPHCVYTYDFGDDWKVDIQLRRIVESPDKFARRLVAGARRFPAEDCGGTWGYEKCCMVLDWKAGGPMPDDADLEEWTEYAEWIGYWQPDDWNVDEERDKFEAKGRRHRTGRI